MIRRRSPTVGQRSIGKGSSMTTYLFADKANMHDVVHHQRESLVRVVAETPADEMIMPVS